MYYRIPSSVFISESDSVFPERIVKEMELPAVRRRRIADDFNPTSTLQVPTTRSRPSRSTRSPAVRSLRFGRAELDSRTSSSAITFYGCVVERSVVYFVGILHIPTCKCALAIYM